MREPFFGEKVVCFNGCVNIIKMHSDRNLRSTGKRKEEKRKNNTVGLNVLQFSKRKKERKKEKRKKKKGSGRGKGRKK